MKRAFGPLLGGSRTSLFPIGSALGRLRVSSTARSGKSTRHWTSGGRQKEQRALVERVGLAPKYVSIRETTFTRIINDAIWVP